MEKTKYDATMAILNPAKLSSDCDAKITGINDATHDIITKFILFLYEFSKNTQNKAAKRIP